MPVGAFLSGGVDSTVVCAVLVDAGFADLQTFTVTIPGHPSDECRRAKEIARHLGLSHQEIPLDTDTDAKWLDQALGDMDVPSIDGPNTWLVSKAVHDAGMKVACSGIGGDELFFGYPSFKVVPQWYRRARWFSMLRSTRKLNAMVAAYLPAFPRWSRMVDALVVGGSIAALWFAKRGLFSAGEVRSLLTDAANARVCDREPIERVEKLECPAGLSPERQVSFYELSVYMHDQLLRDTDCMSMAHSLEVRVPLISRRLVELVAGFASSLQLPCMGKNLLRLEIAQQVPAELLSQQKQGFTLDWQTLCRSRNDRTLVRAWDGLRDIVREKELFSNRHSAQAVPPDLVLEALGLALRYAGQTQVGLETSE